MLKSVLAGKKPVFFLLISVIVSLITIGLGLYSAIERSRNNAVNQLKMVVSNLQLGNKLIYSDIDANLKLVAGIIESGNLPKFKQTANQPLHNVLGATSNATAVGYISESGEEYFLFKNKEHFLSYYFEAAQDTLATISGFVNNKIEWKDSILNNRYYNTELFESDSTFHSNYFFLRQINDIPGFVNKKGLSVSAFTTDTLNNQKYVIVFYITLEQALKNLSDIEIGNAEIILFTTDSLYYNKTILTDSLEDSNLEGVFVPWKKIENIKHSLAIQNWQRNRISDTAMYLKFKSGADKFWVAYSPIKVGWKDFWYTVLVPANDLQSLFQGKLVYILIISFLLLMLSGIGFMFYLGKISGKSGFEDITAESLKIMIQDGESELLEFKSTVRFNLNSGKPGKEIELAWLKSVAAFCNTDGGTILIGVKDNGEIMGLETDDFQNDDKCLLHIQNLMKEHIGLEFSHSVKYSLIDVEGKKVLAVQCIPTKRIMLLKSAGKEQFFVRTGPASIELPLSKALEYMNDRKKSF